MFRWSNGVPKRPPLSRNCRSLPAPSTTRQHHLRLEGRVDDADQLPRLQASLAVVSPTRTMKSRIPWFGGRREPVGGRVLPAACS